MTSSGLSLTRRTSTKEGLGKSETKKKDSGSEKVDAREFAQPSIPWHHIAIRRVAHRAGEHHQSRGHDTFDI